MARTLLWTMALAATAMTADAALPDTTGYVNDGLNSNVALQLYINFRNASNKAEVPIYLASIPDDVKTRLSASGVSDFSKLDGRVQRAVLWDMGYAINGDYAPMKVYTLDGRKMSELTVSLDEFHDVGCVETNCTQPDGGISYSNLYCNGTQMQLAAKCAVGEFEDTRSIHEPMWSTGGDPNAAPVLELKKHTWDDSGASFKVYAIHTSDTEAAYDDCLKSAYNNYVVPCQGKDSLVDSSANFSAPEQSEWIDTWLSEFQDSDPTTEGNSGFKLVYLIPIIAGVLVLAGFAFYCFVRRRRRRTNDEVDKDAVHDSVIDPSALLSPNNKDSHSSQFRIAVSEDSARPTLSTGTRTTMGSVTDPDEFGSNSILRTLFHDPNLADKRIPAEQIQLESVLSKGAYGEVWLADIAGQKVAVKRLLQTKQPTFGEFQDFTNEIQLSASLDHPNIIQFVGVAWTSLNTLMLVLEFLPTGDLQTYLRKNADLLSWARDKIHMAVGLARALEYLHARVPPLIHRDLKSKNVLLTANLDPKLIDFGVSRSLQAEQMTAGVGTPYWTAPEVLEGTQYTEQSDIYSFGVLLTELDTCKIPYADAVNSAGAALKPFQILQDVVAGTLRPTLTPDAPPRIRRVADACLQRDPRNRPNASALIAMLEG